MACSRGGHAGTGGAPCSSPPVSSSAQAPCPQGAALSRGTAARGGSTRRFRIEGIELLRTLYAAQRIATDRDQPPAAGAGRFGEAGGQEHVLIERAAHGGDPA